eukprot:scaffold1528_cov198-Pinguiococcus_pyrenoidosus.AAC.5
MRGLGIPRDRPAHTLGQRWREVVLESAHRLYALFRCRPLQRDDRVRDERMAAALVPSSLILHAAAKVC